MNVTINHPNSSFTGTITVLETVAVGFTNGVASVDIPPQAIAVFSSMAGFSYYYGAPTPAPPYDANLDTSVNAIVGNASSASAGTLRAAYQRRWQANTAYASGDIVIDPSGQIVQAKADFTSTTSYSATNWTVLSGGGVAKDSHVWDIRDHGAVCDGVTSDTQAINALSASVAAAGGGTIYFPPKTIAIGRQDSTIWTKGGIILRPNVELRFDNTKLVLVDNCAFIQGNPGFASSPDLGATATITADTAVTDTNFTVDSSASFTVGQDVFVQLGQAAYDTGEPDYWFWAKVSAVPDATHITLDKPAGYAMTVASVSNTAHRSIRVVTNPLVNWSITGHVDMVNPMTGSANAEAGIYLYMARDGRIENVSGENTGAGLINLQYCENVTVDVVTLRKSLAQNGQTSKGGSLNFSECRNVRVNTARLFDNENIFVSVEARCENVVLGAVYIANGIASRSAFAKALFLTLGFARLHIESVYVTGNNSFFYDNGSTNPGHLTIDRAVINTAADCNISDPSIFRQSLEIRGKVYDEIARYSKKFTPVNNDTLYLVAGIIRRMRIYASSTTGLTGMYPSSASNNGPDVHSQVVAGATTPITGTLEIGASGGSTAVNHDETQKRIYFNSDGTWVSGTVVTVEVEYFRPSGGANDFSNGLIAA
jgi:hypothetical protein